MSEQVRRFLKIGRGFSGPGITLKWSEGCADGGWIRRMLGDPHPATEGFNAAFDALLPTFVKPLGLDAAQRQGLRVIGAHMTYTKEGDVSLQVSAARPLAGFSSPYCATLPKQTPDKALQTLIDALSAKAEAYIDGKKGQLEMEPEPEEE